MARRRAENKGFWSIHAFVNGIKQGHFGIKNRGGKIDMAKFIVACLSKNIPLIIPVAVIYGTYEKIRKK